MRTLVQVSGGYDSATVLTQAVAAGHDCVAFFANYGQPYYEQEAKAVEYLVTERFPNVELTNPEIDLWVSGTSSYVPARNLVLTAASVNAAVATGCGQILVGSRGLAGFRFVEGAYRDSSLPFFRRLNRLVRKSSEPGEPAPRIRMPLAGWTKRRVMAYLTDQGVDLTRLWSCYGGGSVPCLTCKACVSREEAMAKVQ